MNPFDPATPHVSKFMTVFPATVSLLPAVVAV
jgi:hypothetical protein